MHKYILILLISGIAMNAVAETLTVDSFSIEVESGWTYNTEEAAAPGDSPSNLITLTHPEGLRALNFWAYFADKQVDNDLLRNLTNVPLSTTLTLQAWGEFSGYQYNYLERSKFIKQWWLSYEETVLWVYYESENELDPSEMITINKMINSIKSPQR